MSKVQFENEYFKSEKNNDGSFVITILKDDQNFYGVDMQDCKLITNSYGFIKDEFTEKALNNISAKCNTPEEIHLLKCELRNRQLNTLIQYL